MERVTGLTRIDRRVVGVWIGIRHVLCLVDRRRRWGRRCETDGVAGRLDGIQIDVLADHYQLGHGRYRWDHRDDLQIDDDGNEMIRTLIQAGAEVDACDNEGHTPLHQLCNYYEEDDWIDRIRALIEAGANPDLRDIWGKTPLEYTPEGVALLLQPKQTTTTSGEGKKAKKRKYV